MQQVVVKEAAKAEQEQRPLRTIKMVFLQTKTDPRRYNESTGDGVAAIFVGEEGVPPTSVDFTLHSDTGELSTISNLMGHMDLMVYPLLFPNGEMG